jgi:hypothetical protein
MVFELAGQAVHRDSLAAAVDAEYLPAPQSVHVALFGTEEYLPSPHATHAPPLGPTYPALHTHAVSSVLREGEFELTGHEKQDAAPERAY